MIAIPAKNLPALIFSAALAAASSISGAYAQGGAAPRIAVPQGPNTQIAVPDGPDAVAGCYRLNRPIYGPYQLDFCLQQFGEGHYTVLGGGLNCQGGLDWSVTGADTVRIGLNRTSCGGGVAWTADNLHCRASVLPPIGPFGAPGAVTPQIAVPDVPHGATALNCTYQPSVAGYQAVVVTANRVQ